MRISLDDEKAYAPVLQTVMENGMMRFCQKTRGKSDFKEMFKAVQLFERLFCFWGNGKAKIMHKQVAVACNRHLSENRLE